MSVVYQVTVHIQTDAEAEWLSYMRDEHVPDVMRAGYFSGFEWFAVIYPAPEQGESTYCLQYRVPSMEAYDAYQKEAAPALQQDHTSRFEGRFRASRAVYQQVEDE